MGRSLCAMPFAVRRGGGRPTCPAARSFGALASATLCRALDPPKLEPMMSTVHRHPLFHSSSRGSRDFLDSRSSVPVGLTCACGQNLRELVSNRTVAFPRLPLSISREPVSGHLTSSLRKCLAFSSKQHPYRLPK